MIICFVIAWNSFRELVRQPVYLVLLGAALGLGPLAWWGGPTGALRNACWRAHGRRRFSNP